MADLGDINNKIYLRVEGDVRISATGCECGFLQVSKFISKVSLTVSFVFLKLLFDCCLIVLNLSGDHG